MYKNYINGLPILSGEHTKARNLLINEGIYSTLGNFGPFTPNKLDRNYKTTKIIRLEEFEFHIIESEVMSFSFDSMSISKPHKHREAWFMPLKK